MSGFATTQNILHIGYFWPSMFKDYINVVRKCHNCQIYDQNMRAHPTPLHPIIDVGDFAKWGIDFLTCKSHLDGGAWVDYPCNRLFYKMGPGDAYVQG